MFIPFSPKANNFLNIVHRYATHIYDSKIHNHLVSYINWVNLKVTESVFDSIAKRLHINLALLARSAYIWHIDY